MKWMPYVACAEKSFGLDFAAAQCASPNDGTVHLTYLSKPLSLPFLSQKKKPFSDALFCHLRGHISPAKMNQSRLGPAGVAPTEQLRVSTAGGRAGLWCGGSWCKNSRMSCEGWLGLGTWDSERTTPYLYLPGGGRGWLNGWRVSCPVPYVPVSRRDETTPSVDHESHQFFLLSPRRDTNKNTTRSGLRHWQVSI